MIILKPKKLLCWILFGLITYQLFGYVKVQTYGDVVVYKRLAKAIMKNDDYELRHVSVGDVASGILNTQAKREALFSTSKILLTYYKIKSRSLSADEQSVFLIAEQVSRVNPLGYDTLWGESEVRIKHEVRLVMKRNHWVVANFVDPAIKP
jgi:hypothetical protein